MSDYSSTEVSYVNVRSLPCYDLLRRSIDCSVGMKLCLVSEDMGSKVHRSIASML